SDAVNTLLELRGVHFVSARRGWIVGAQGTILTTGDAGGSWTAQVSGSTGYTLNAVSFATTSSGVVVGTAGRILRTTNGGQSWSALLGVDTDNLKGLNDVFFQDEGNGWIVGNGGLILRTVNGGASWVRVLPGVTVNDLERVSFPRFTTSGAPPVDTHGRGWIVGGAGTILTSADFGQSWRIVTPFVTTDPLFGVARRSVGDAIAVGSNNRVAVTTASGDTALWALAPPPAPFSNLTAVAWPGTTPLPAPAWAVGKWIAGGLPVVFRSIDGGLSWTAQDLPADAPLLGNGLNDVYFLDDRRGWAVGTQGLVLHTATGGF
ncbi:MAG: YCF48-related protein, partial [Candidatus Eisenbacteria bacterium]